MAKGKKSDVIGVTGVVRYGNRSRVEDEWHPNLRGRLAARVYREMGDNDAGVGSSLNLIKSTLRQVPWEAREADGSDEARRWAEHLHECTTDMDHTWADFVSEVPSILLYGWAAFEKVMKRREDGLVGWRGFFPRAQESLHNWEWDEEGNVTGMWQLAQSVQARPVFIPSEKLLHFRTEYNRGSPEGRSLLRNVYRSWFFLKRLEELEAVGMERDLAGIPVVEVPISLFEAAASSSPASAAKRQLLADYERLVQQMRRNDREGVVFPAETGPDGKPTGYRLRLLSTGGSRALDVGEAIRRYQKAIAINFNTQFQLLGVDTNGSMALSSDMTSTFAQSLGAILDSMQEVINRFAVRELMELNGVPRNLWPQLVHGDIEREDAERFATTMAALVTAGVVTPDPELEDFAREKMLYPPRARDDVEGPDAGISPDTEIDQVTETPEVKPPPAKVPEAPAPKPPAPVLP